MQKKKRRKTSLKKELRYAVSSVNIKRFSNFFINNNLSIMM